jgi:hypothetical protein
MLQAALEYRTKWHVFPAPPGTKKSYKSAAHSDGRKWGKTRDEAELRRDWERWPEANIGVPTGKDNGFWVMETDTHDGGHAHDGEESLAALVAANGGLPETRLARSPSGSIHYYFTWPDDGGTEIKNTAGKIGPGIDTRGEGGMVIAPPSNRGAGCYEWLNDSAVAPAPAWLVELARTATRRSASSSSSRDGAAHCDLDRLEAALKELPNPLPVLEELQGGWEDWNKIVMAIYAATGGMSVGLRLTKEWSAKNEVRYDEANTEEKWRKLSQTPPMNIGAGFIFKLLWKINPNWDRISCDDFYSHLPAGSYLFVPTMEHWQAKSVDGFLPPVQITYQDADGNTKVKKIKPHLWLDQNRPIQQMTWLPGKPMIIENRLLTKEGVWVDRRRAKSYNSYRAPTLVPGDGRLAGPFFDLVDKVVGENRQHVLAWFAHRIQRPYEKINHCLVIGGSPGIGKDSMIEPLRRAVGPHNFAEVDPPRMIGRFNGFLQAVVLRVSEARDLGDINRYAFYEHLKLYTATQSDVIPIEEKYLPTYPIANVVSLVITTNYKDGLYLPADDRRTHVSWSDARIEDVGEDFFTEYWNWLNAGGDGHVMAYLRDFDLARFNPYAPPPKTNAFWEAVAANVMPESIEVANVIESGLGSPKVFNQIMFFNKIPLESDLRDWAQRNKRVLGRRFADCGYVAIAKPGTGDGMWRINRYRMENGERKVESSTRTVVYVKANLSPREQIKAIQEFLVASEEVIDEVRH